MTNHFTYFLGYTWPPSNPTSFRPSFKFQSIMDPVSRQGVVWMTPSLSSVWYSLGRNQDPTKIFHRRFLKNKVIRPKSRASALSKKSGKKQFCYGPTDRRTDQRTNGPTDRWTDTPSYRVMAHDSKGVDWYSDMLILTYCLGQNRRQKEVFASWFNWRSRIWS